MWNYIFIAPIVGFLLVLSSINSSIHSTKTANNHAVVLKGRTTIIYEKSWFPKSDSFKGKIDTIDTKKSSSIQARNFNKR